MTDSHVSPSPAGLTTSVSVGETLRRQRESLGLSVAEVANSLKLNVRQVDALESGRFELLPGAAFTRGFLRNYARLLKLDPAPLLASVQSAVATDAVELSPVSNAQGDMPKVGRGRFRRSVLPGMLAALALFGLVVAGWYYDNQRKQTADALIAEAQAPEPVAAPTPAPAAEPADAPPGVAAPTAEAASSGGTVPPGTTSSVPDLAPAQVAPTVSATPGPLAAPEDSTAKAVAVGGKDKLVFDFSQDAWVEVKEKGGKVLFSKLGKAGSKEIVEAAPPLAVTIGNARSVKLERNGQAVDLGLGSKSTVARLKFE